MYISRQNARSIVDEMKTAIHRDINIMDENGVILASDEKRAFEIFADKGEGDHDMLYAEDFALTAGAFDFAGVMFRTVVEGDGEDDLLLSVVEKRHGVHAAREHYY